MLVEDECDLEDPLKYEEINKILEEVDMPYSDWLEEDNITKSNFFHFVDEIEIANMIIS